MSKITEYQAFVKTTFAYVDKQDNIVRMTNHQFLGNILDAALGVASELIEFENESDEYFNPDREERPVEIIDSAVAKELGDIVYYLSMVHNLVRARHDIDYVTVIQIPTEPSTYRRDIEELCDLIKKKYVYGQDIHSTEILDAVSRSYNWVAFEARGYETSLIGIMEQNMEKLKKRYPKGKFDTQDSAIKADIVTVVTQIEKDFLPTEKDAEEEELAYIHEQEPFDIESPESCLNNRSYKEDMVREEAKENTFNQKYETLDNND